MIIHSDNTATNLMIDRLGMDRVNRYLKEHGYKDTTLRRKMMDFDAAKKGAENMTTVRDVGLLFKRLYQGKCVSKDLDAQMLAIYKAQVDTDMLPDKLPKGTVVATRRARCATCATMGASSIRQKATMSSLYLRGIIRRMRRWRICRAGFMMGM